MLDIILSENLLTDACMTIIDGRNEYGFHAAKVPDSSLEKTAPGKYNITLRGGDGKDIVVNATAPENGKKTNFWLISFEEGNYNVICVQYDDNGEPSRALEQKEYMSVIALFLDHYKIGTRTKLMNILKELKSDSEKFRVLGITFEEKAFFDVLVEVRDKHGFEYADDLCIELSLIHI